MRDEAEIVRPTLSPLATRLRGILCTYAARDFPAWWTTAIEEAADAAEQKDREGLMNIGIGNLRASLILGYRGHGQRYGLIPFGNGYTLRAGGVALHVWRLGPNDRSPR